MSKHYMVAILSVEENPDKTARAETLRGDLAKWLDLKLVEVPSDQPNAPYWVTDLTLHDTRDLDEFERVSTLVARHRRSAKRRAANC